jgi:hypothetical protein
MAYEQFLKDWKDADADVPEVIAARQKTVVVMQISLRASDSL